MKSRMLILLLWFISWVPVHAASFDCGKAASRIEKLICGDDVLSKLDEGLANAYQGSLSQIETKQKVVNEQRRWLKETRSACLDTECLKKLYRSRIASLTNGVEVGKLLKQEPTFYAPACATKLAPEFCTWHPGKVMASEQHIVDGAIENINKVILPNLKGAMWVPYDGFDPTNPKIEAYCASKLAALREGHFKLFPQPDAKSSQIGFQLLNKQVEEIERRERFRVSPETRASDEKKMADAFVIAQLDTEYFNPYASTSWLYKLHHGYVLLNLNPSNGQFRLGAVFDQPNIGVGLGKLISSQTEPTESGSGFFSEQAFGLVEIEGELFGIEGGVMLMDDDVYRWKNEIYQAIQEKTSYMGRNANSTWPTRLLALYPMNPPWKEYYRQLNLPAGKTAIGEGDFRAKSKPCMWYIQD